MPPVGQYQAQPARSILGKNYLQSHPKFQEPFHGFNGMMFPGTDPKFRYMRLNYKRLNDNSSWVLKYINIFIFLFLFGY